MSAGLKYVCITLAVLFVLALCAVWQRHWLLFHTLGSGEPPPLLPAGEEPGAVWFDDYFTVHQIDARTWAIGEPRYLQQNYSYLITGTRRAILFDAGPGLRDMRPVIESLTRLPITFIPSHFHYDHIGNDITFEHVAVIDLPHIRSRAPDGRLALTWAEHAGAAEGFATPVLEVDEWLAPGQRIPLGDRVLQVVYTPGHTTDSVSLLDPDTRTLFSGDYLYPGPLYAFLPNSNMGDYVQATERVLGSGVERLLGAHRAKPPGLPKLGIGDVRDLARALDEIQDGVRSGEGVFPVAYPVNDRLQLLAEPGFLQTWTPTYPVQPAGEVEDT